MQKTPMTVNGMLKLRQELERLLHQERPAISLAIGEARAHGDLKENAEYHAAKEKQGLIEARIRDIESKISSAHVIDVAKLPRSGIVVFGTTIGFLNLTRNTSGKYQLVGDDEANIDEGKISINSPIARALVGKQVGDIALASTPQGVLELEITSIDYI